MKMSIGQKKAMSEFFVNGAVAWLSAGIIAPLFLSEKTTDFINATGWGLFFTGIFITFSLLITRGVRT